MSIILGQELLLLWNSTNVMILNLEVPFSDKKDIIDKCGPNIMIKKGIKTRRND